MWNDEAAQEKEEARREGAVVETAREWARAWHAMIDMPLQAKFRSARQRAGEDYIASSQALLAAVDALEKARRGEWE